MLIVIKERKSVRTYLEKDLTEKDLKAVKQIVKKYNETKGYFGHEVKLDFFDKPFVYTPKKAKIGTYGFITNPPSFIAGCVDNSFYGMVDYGFIFENMILDLTEKKLGTVWIGGTFDRHTFDFMHKDHEIVPTITPVGYEDADHHSSKEDEVRERVHADRREPFDKLFFNNDFDTPLDETHAFAKALNYVRLAPSTDNKQPWRILVKDHDVHFYLERTPAYGESLDFDVQAIDMGIALSHFVKGLEELGLKFKVSNDFVNIKLPDYEYAFSVKVSS
ncbi:hypothetical protein BK010_06115 [Tenericutes bacterium MO-XQ]|nr:hypothetical protein BK010_06115 [Tenericutes bacterium MO-XQ]